MNEVSHMYIVDRHQCVHLTSSADELSRQCGDQTQSPSEEAAGCFLRQVSLRNVKDIFHNSESMTSNFLFLYDLQEYTGKQLWYRHPFLHQ